MKCSQLPLVLHNKLLEKIQRSKPSDERARFLVESQRTQFGAGRLSLLRKSGGLALDPRRFLSASEKGFHVVDSRDQRFGLIPALNQAYAQASELRLALGAGIEREHRHGGVPDAQRLHPRLS